MKELSPPPLNLRRLYSETVEWEPVLIIISPGADPSQELAELAAETVGRDNYHEVKDNSPMLFGQKHKSILQKMLKMVVKVEYHISHSLFFSSVFFLISSY